jgi:hypothetical protein
MFKLGIAFGAYFFYMIEWYGFSFWILIYAIVNSAMGAVWAVADPNAYASHASAHGVLPNYTQLFITKGIALAILVPVAWHVGSRAAYF